jgi:succinate dehydrogenase assembly factor 1
MVVLQEHKRLSGIQKQVLSLFRSFLRVARSKSPDTRLGIERYVGDQFRRDAHGIDKKDFQRIEYLLRRGTKQLELLKANQITGFKILDPDKVFLSSVFFLHTLLFYLMFLHVYKLR